MTTEEKVLTFPQVEIVSDERGSDDGIFIYYQIGWRSSTDSIEPLHVEHEDTWKECLELVKISERCNCGECHAYTSGHRSTQDIQQ